MKKEIIDFFADGCGNCKMLEPILAQVETEFSDIKFSKLNVKDAEVEVAKFGVSSLPTLVFLKDGTVVDKMVGLKPKTLIVKKINEVFS